MVEKAEKDPWPSYDEKYRGLAPPDHTVPLRDGTF